MKIYAPALALGLSLLCNICPPQPASADNMVAAASTTSTTTTETTGTAPADAKADVKGDAKIDPQVDAILHKVSDFYSGLKTFNTTLVREREKAEGEALRVMKFKVEAEKPAKISIKINGGVERFDGGEAKMNGEKLYLYNPIIGYVDSKATANYDDLIRDREFQFATGYVLHGQNFLEALLSENPYQFILQHYGVSGGTLIGEEKIDGIKCNHLHLTSGRIAYEVWVEDGAQPWVRRVCPRRSNDKTEAIIVIYNYEKPSAEIKEREFDFTPPAAAKQVITFFGLNKPADGLSQAAIKTPQTVHEDPLLNKPAPQIQLDTLGGGKLDLESYKSKNVVVLDFWATWCPPCRKALPIISDVTKSYEDKGVKFFAIDLKEDPAKVQAYLTEQNLNINVALDKDGAIATKYAVEGIPQSVIVGKDGVVKIVHRGLSMDLKTRLAAELDQILAGKDAAQ